jgi:hypothetical protein
MSRKLQKRRELRSSRLLQAISHCPDTVMAIAVAMKSQDGQYSNEFADNICSFYNF